MTIYKNSKILTIVCFFYTVIFFARTGGGKSGIIGSRSGIYGSNFHIFPKNNLIDVPILNFIIAIIALIIIYRFIKFKFKIQLKSIQNKKLISKIATHDNMWEYHYLIDTVEQIFHKVQNVWMDRDLQFIKEIISHSLYQEFNSSINQMIRTNQKNIIKDIVLGSIVIVNIEDFIDNKKDTFSTYIKCSMIDYTINENSNEIISGNSELPIYFNEIWSFIRVKNQWVLNHIEPDIYLEDLNQYRSFSE